MYADRFFSVWSLIDSHSMSIYSRESTLLLDALNVKPHGKHPNLHHPPRRNRLEQERNFTRLAGRADQRCRSPASIRIGSHLPQRRFHFRVERHFGAIQGIPKSELAEANPTMLEQILRRNPAAAFVGGETMDEFADRIFGAFADIGAHHRGSHLLVITHGW